MRKAAASALASLFISQLSLGLKAYALPQGVPPVRCSEIQAPQVGDLCYSVTPGGGKVSAGKDGKDFPAIIIQATEPEFVIADVQLEITGETGDRTRPSISQISPGGLATVAIEAREKLRELKRLSADLEAKATALAGPALVEAQNKLSALKEQESVYEKVVSSTLAAGQDAGKYSVGGASARSRSCGWMNLDTCGSWIEFNVYAVKRYIGNPIAAYNKAQSVALDAQVLINRLSNRSGPPPGPATPLSTSCPEAFSPQQFQGTTGRVALFNEWGAPVTVVLYHPSNGRVFGRFVVPSGQNNILASNAVVGDDWGVCLEGRQSDTGIVNNLGAIADRNSWEGSTLFMIQNPRLR